MKGRLRELWRRLRGGALTPNRAAASVALGLAIGVTPLWGFHGLLVLALCVPLRLDAPVAYVASNVSLPFVAPFITLGEVEIGAYVRTGAWLRMGEDELAAKGLGGFATELVIGTFAMAAVLASLGAAVAYLVTRRRQSP